MKDTFQHLRAVNEVAILLRKDRPMRPVFLLGAGASYRAGIALADEAVRRIARATYQRRAGGRWTAEQVKPSDWMPFLQAQPWFISGDEHFAENFPLAVEHLLVPREFRREFFLEMIQINNGVNPGYLHLADLLMRGLARTVLTTNFDSLIVEALRTRWPHVRHVVETNRVNGDLEQFNPLDRYQVVYLHGAVEYYTDQSIETETTHLKSELVRQLRPLIDNSPVVVIGYRGAEPSIMRDLFAAGAATSAKYKHGVYWCSLSGSIPHPNVAALRDLVGTNFIHLEIEGFDELMGDVTAELKDEDLYELTTTSVVPKRRGFDEQPLEAASLDDLDVGLILATLATYCERLHRAQVTQDNYVGLLAEQGLLCEINGVLRPTIGCYLLFGKDAARRFPHASVAVTRNGKQRRLFDGNLIGQFRAITEYLDDIEINPSLRVKAAMGATERKAYPKRALVEAVVNLLVHRDYEVQTFATIDVDSGECLSFRNPGRLFDRIRRHLNVAKDGSFLPVRDVTEIRNLAVADIFFGIGAMDRAGSGLADLQEMMRENGGDATFAIEDDTGAFRATLLQPRQASPTSSRVARPISTRGLYITNLLPFAVIPEMITIFQAQRARQPGEPLFEHDEQPGAFPLFIDQGPRFISFADLRMFPSFIARRGSPRNIERVRTETFIDNEDDRRLFVWLLRKHWEFYLRGFSERGLEREPRKQRAYFRLLEGDHTSIVYDSAKRRGVRRNVVKRRGASYVWHENEGIAYSIVAMDGTWAIQVKPFYMFTGKDGITPLPSFERTARATRRMKFDRNSNVDDDLSFWARFLSNGSPTIQLPCAGVEDLVLSAAYETIEVPEDGRGTKHAR